MKVVLYPTNKGLLIVYKMHITCPLQLTKEKENHSQTDAQYTVFYGTIVRDPHAHEYEVLLVIETLKHFKNSTFSSFSLINENF